MEKQKNNNDITPKNKLSILIDQGGLSFCVSNQIQEKKITSFFKKKFDEILDPPGILEQIELSFEKADLDLATVEKAQIIFSNSLYAFVPQPLFDENHLSDYLKFNTKILPTDFIAYDELPASKMNNVYIPYTNINNYFFEKLGSFDYQHASSILVKNLLLLEKEDQHETVYVHVFSHHFDVVVIKEKKMILCNSFSFEAPEDFIYYILFIAEQFKLDPEKFSLKFIGGVSSDSEIYKICYTYIRNCSFLEDENSSHKELDLSEFPESKPNYLLLKAHACV